jgi:hypothetical protein
MKRMLGLGVLLLVAPAPVALAQAPTWVRLSTEHYDLRVDGQRETADEMGQLLEQAWTGFDAFFKQHPPETKRLVVKIYADEKEFLAGARNDGAAVPIQSRPVCWSDATDCVYLYGDTRTYTTRRGLIFGAALQFHALCKTKNRDLPRQWYEAGLAHAFARHKWDGKALEMMARPLVEPIDLPARALKAVVADPSGIPKLIDADRPDPILCWSAVGLCLNGDRGKYRMTFEKLALGVTGSKTSGEDFLRSLGDPKVLAKDLYAWLEREQTPFEAVVGDWADAGSRGIIGSVESQKQALCILKEPKDDLDCTLGILPKTSGEAGLVAGYWGPGDCTLIVVVAPTLRVEKWHEGKMVKLDTFPIPGDHQKERKLSLMVRGVNARIEVDGVEFPPREVGNGRIGLYVTGAQVAFKDVRWK